MTDRRWLNGRTLIEDVQKALEGGVTCVQLREKDMNYDQFKSEALAMKQLCATYHVPLIINDRVDMMQEIDADGVHVGQSDMDARQVRKIIGSDKILGVSARTVEQALAAQQAGADYLGVGAVFSTNTKADAQDLDLNVLKEICQRVNIPVVAIGGIQATNILQLQNSGIDGVAVVSAIMAQSDILSATQELKERVEKL